MPRDHSKPFRFETTNGNPGWRDQIERTITKCQDNDVDTAPLDEILEPLDPPVDENGEPRKRKWSEADVKTVVDKLIEVCPDVAVESLGGTGVEGEAPLDEEFREDTVLEEGEREDGKRLRWRQRVYDKIDLAIDFVCETCWTIFADVNVTFVGNLTPNPQTIALTTPAPPDTTEEGLAEMLSDALVAWLAEQMDTISNLEGFNIEATGQVSLSQGPGGPDCVYSFLNPIIES